MLTIVIVAWNCKDELMACLQSLAMEHPFPVPLETIVVDNASDDGTADLLRHYIGRFSLIGLKVIVNSRNVGLSVATEQAYEMATGDFILLCNPDISFNHDVNVLLSYGRAHPESLITAEMVNRDGSIQRVIHRRFPNLTRVFFDFAIVGEYLDGKLMNHAVRKNFCYQGEKFASIESLEAPGASFLLMNRSLIDRLAFIFDPVFPVWWNDADLARRAERVGIPRVLISGVKVTHRLGGSGSSKMPDLERRFVFCKSMIIYARRWKMHPNLTQLLFFADAIFSVPLTAAVRSRGGGFSRVFKNSILLAAAQISAILGA